MDCYPARIIHDDRMKTLRAEAAQARLAAELPRDRSRFALARARRWLRQALGRSSGWARGNALAHSLGGSLRPATDPQLREDA
jgi:hypothetical protein